MSFATNDERTAKRVSDALGTATELKAQRNYAGHRLSPWLGHLMVSRQETARPLLTPGEVMQLPPTDELVLVSGLHPIRAKKARFYEDAQLKARVLAPPKPGSAPIAKASGAQQRTDDWTTLVLTVTSTQPGNRNDGGQTRGRGGSGKRRHPARTGAAGARGDRAPASAPTPRIRV